jgi:uncharacterized membrane protein YkvA (DUF1232 family)
MNADQKIEVLQRFVNTYADDLLAARAVVGDKNVPVEAQRLVIGALNYALDMLDIFPDHYKGLGIADDAIVLRLAAKLAVAAGATHEAITRLANEAADVAKVFPDHVTPLEALVAKFPERDVRGRTAARIVEHKDTRIMFEADIGREAKRHTAQVIDTKVEGPERALIELRKMIDHAIAKAGISK